MRGKTWIACATSVVVLGMAAVAHGASFSGTPKGDPQAEITFKVSGTTKNGKFVNGKVSEIRITNHKFVCYTKSGTPVNRGRVDIYPWFSIKPTPIKPDGSFNGRHTFKTRGYTIEDMTFKGRIVRNGKGKFEASGTYQAKVSEGGIEFGFCGDKNPVKWEAKVGGG